MNGTDKPFGSCEHEVYLSEGDVIYFLQKDSITYVVFGFCIMSEIVDTYAASEVRNRDVFDDSVIIREFGIRKGLKKLVISSKIRIFIGENQ